MTETKADLTFAMRGDNINNEMQVSIALTNAVAPKTVLYYVLATAVYLCIAALIVLSAYFGRRARRNVKREKVTRLPVGVSPLDVQRVFIGKTYPSRLTRALLAHWAQLGYIKIVPVSRFKVHIRHIKEMPPHDSEDAVYYDRGTYVRERALFEIVINKYRNKPINLFLPMFTRDELKKWRESFAGREDEGVYDDKHYRLKVAAVFLSVAPIILMSIWLSVYSSPVHIIMLLIGAMGFFVLRFMTEMPLPFRLLWCSLWLGVPIIFLIVEGGKAFDPMFATYAACAIMLVGPFVLIRFCDYRVKNNLAEYSDLINYRKYLLFSDKSELENTDYYAALPFIYAYKISFFVKRKYGERKPPDWIKKNPDGSVERSAIL